MGNRTATYVMASAAAVVVLSGCGHRLAVTGAQAPLASFPGPPTSGATLVTFPPPAFPKPAPDPRAPACHDGRSAQRPELAVAGIGSIVAMSGEHGFYVAFGTSGTPCNLRGYPSVTFWSGNKPAPIVVQLGGGPYRGSKPPPAYVTLRPGYGPTATFLVAKYRCDAGIIEPITEARVRLPGSATTYRLGLTGWGMDVCKPAGRGAPDPGNTVWIGASDYATSYLSPLSDTRY